ncbi:ATP-binding protein [Nonomuraea sp. NPDC050663]|uniref:ATP-binding protein n=1 Tax=Nonomuraea sp. NPDC050663 TaxID=3364370 RepID=UPI0037937B30
MAGRGCCPSSTRIWNAHHSRRRVGKSRLAEEFVRRSGLPSLFFAATTRPTAFQLPLFRQAAQSSTLPGAGKFAEWSFDSWDGALRLLAEAIPEDTPSIVVIDELPFLLAADPWLEGTRRPVLLLLIGSDLSIMESINQYDRPFYMRAVDMVIHPPTPADVQRFLQLAPSAQGNAATPR